MTFLDQCSALVAEYVALLVPEWQIQVEVANIYPTLGECYPSWEYKGGLLRFHDREAYPVQRPYDLDLTVAHEVGHCVLAVMCTEAGTWQRRAEEWIVETFARAMVALRRGLRAAPAKLAAEMRHLMRATVVRRRTAGAEGKKRMDPELAKLILALGAMLEVEQVSAELRTAIEALVAKASGGDVESPASGEEPPEGGEPPMAAVPGAPEDPKPRQPTAAARRADIEALLATAEADAKRTFVLTRKALVVALLDSAPDVFPAALPARRARYANASPEEIERYIASAREDKGLDPGDGRRREAPAAPAIQPPGSSAAPLVGALPAPPATGGAVPIRRIGPMFAGGDK